MKKLLLVLDYPVSLNNPYEADTMQVMAETEKWES